MTPADALRLRASRLLMAALVAHDLEEAIAFPLQRPAIVELVPRAPPAGVFLVALAVVTVGGVLLLCWAGRGADTPGRRLAIRGVAWVLLVNVLVPHAPAAVLLGGYAPGVATAVLVNLPVSLLALRLTARR